MTTTYAVRYALRRFSGIEVEATAHAIAVVTITETNAAGKDKALRIRKRLTQAGIKSRQTAITLDGRDRYHVVVDR